MSTYSADQIIGKNLLANKPVNIYRLPDDNAKAVYTAKAGEYVGTVFSYIKPSPEKNRKFLYWQFKDQNNKFFYVRHEEGAFDVKSLKDQGAITVKEQTEGENQNKFEMYFKKYGVPILAGIAAVYLIANLGGKYIQSRS